ncbi:hypothetical protein B0H15DRAFT_780646 [Mycena belliarum]|uniref:Integrase core domain-containing protein n=1 Tax=Mycena belliarum TaxID=1033014 RepID=A0AAD6U2T8_9AGAR|nr:hypothetical protein B0H15DRAFT_780646 [Mycena belliae]
MLIPLAARSTRNTRIERLWVEVGTQFARRWRAFFTRLGRLHHLDRKDPGQLWLLHLLFLPELNSDCREFQDEWNLHPISGRTTSDQSPADMRFLGQTTQGMYRQDLVTDQDDPLDGIHPDAINRYYGVAGPRLRRGRHQTGAGIASDDDDNEDGSQDNDDPEPTLEEQLENRIEEDLARNIRHQPVKVARHHTPFRDADVEHNFLDLLQDIIEQPAMLPEDYGVLEDEWDGDDYPETEIIKPGTSGKELVIILPRAVWYPRAVKWAQSLDFLTRFMDEMQDEGSDPSTHGSDDSD